MSDAQIVVGIPTFRRPELLRRLLDDVAPQVRAAGGAVVVGDNDADDAVRAIVDESRGRGLDVTWVPVREPGVSQNRNAIIRAALELHPGLTWLVMLDDDGRVGPGWLEALVRGATAHDADVAGGPVDGDLPARASRLARNSLFAGRDRQASGPTERLNGAQNIAVARRLLDRLDAPWFDPRLGGVGGEDYDFFRRARALGARLVWVDEAPVVEPTPADRLGTRAILRRVFRSNVVAGGIDRQYDGLVPAGRHVLRGYPVVLRGAAGALRHRDPDRALRTLVFAVGAAGRTGGVLLRRPGRPAPAGRHYGR